MQRFASARAFPALLVLGTTLVAIGCRAATSRISGSYIAKESNAVTMLQLTQTANGQITGVYDYAALDSGGEVSSNQIPITNGVLDGNQLTLTVNGGILGFFPDSLGHNIAGILEGNTIRLQIVGSGGDIATMVATRSSPGEFETYTDQLKVKGEGISFNAKLLKDSQELRLTTQNAEQWTSNAEVDAQKISSLEKRYQEIEDKMHSLVVREHSTTNSVERSQISVAVNQMDFSGISLDNTVNYLWDVQIENSGAGLYKSFANWRGNCGDPDDLRARYDHGASAQTVETWESACKQALAERESFVPTYKQIMERRAQLKSFQATAEGHRQALLNEASRVQ